MLAAGGASPPPIDRRPSRPHVLCENRDFTRQRRVLGPPGALRIAGLSEAKPVTEPRPLAMRTKLAFGVGASAEAGIHIAFNAFNFLYYNNVLGLSGTLAGLAVTIALVFDAVSDPVVGSISDRWRSKLGRRHPFMYAAAIPMAALFFCIYAPPESLSGFSLFLWLTCFTILLRTALTLYHVPHLALGAELTTDYRERSVVMSYNSIFGVVGGASAFFFAASSINGANSLRLSAGVLPSRGR